MSEYQYYELRAVDHPLDDQAQRDLRAISSRATITATRFTNTYAWGNLKADPAKMLARWFDALLHVTNWGTRWLAFRLPQGAIPADDRAPYQVALFSSQDDGPHCCVHFLLEDEDPGEWMDGEAWLGSLLPLRDALAVGDLRCLYLAWLVDLQRGHLDDDDVEPPVPPGLGTLDAAHEAFVEFMEVDPDLLAVAAEASAPLQATAPSQAAVLAWLGSIDSAEKDRWLLRVLDGDGVRVGWELHRRLRGDRGPRTTGGAEPRTAGALLQRAEAHAEERRRRLERERAVQRKEEAERRAAARRRHLDLLEGSEPSLWRKIDALIATLKPKAYDEATVLLADLRDLADRRGDRAGWEARLHALRVAHGRKPSLLQRLDKLTQAG